MSGNEQDDRDLEPNLAGRPNGLLGVVLLWFSLRVDVSRTAYALSGFGLMVLKYAVEAGLIYHYTGRVFSPFDFLNPLLSMREQFLRAPAPDWLGWLLFVWTMPFLWIAVSMSVRRAANANVSAWVGLLVLMPLVNFLIMILLCLLPETTGFTWAGDRIPPRLDHRVRSALLGILASVGILLVMVLIGIYALADYGATLFLGTPIVMGATSAFLYNRPYPRDLLSSLLVAQASILVAGAVLMLFALEGLICLAMLYPIAAAMGLLGGLIGHAVGALTSATGRMLFMAVFALPLLAGAEILHRPTPVYEVISSVEIDAPPNKVWPNVIGFAELPAPPAWYFKLGIAYPKRATIEGTGVGAVRHCEFSTGAFVEPITVWDPPDRLAFDVASQPPPMHELSPYRHVHPPHLDGYLRCQRGEFRLIELPGGRTRLEGSTWYKFQMYPMDYWTLWSDATIHRIHVRVLEHIKRLSEDET